MTPEFIRLTNRDGGGDLFLRRSMVAAVGSYWNGKQQVTHVTLINEDVDYEVKESLPEVMARLAGKTIPREGHSRPLTDKSMFGTLPPKGKQDEKNHAADREEVQSTDCRRELTV